ncbi:CDP-glycerol glycerophosphotransferase family protein [Staphylococcus equorum]|uniref:CDP-glycerol glycerophosphotransferase family protein n=1 Tax=Staphylococcus equorum TaxID=246432 RepID=UPI0019190ABD|nr:CDP-glycerol glycerophosphotransferase family protein [Staphylococcus equorum]QQT17443.1 CDP-glycerol glycerophosphotransferase family protein [Staphylococcus equorum]
MEILLILFKTKNMNKNNFEKLANSSFFSDVIIIDEEFDRFTYQIEKSYDFVLFANPNFEIKVEQVSNGMKKIKNSSVNVVQWTLRDVDSIKNNRYSFANYRDLFSPVLINLDSQISQISLQDYFNAISYIKEKAYIGTFYIGRDLRNKIYKEDLTNLTIALLNYSSEKSFLSIFQTETDLINFFDFIIDNQVFEKIISKDQQLKLLKLMNLKLKNIKGLQLKEKTNLHLVYRLIFEKYYDEALAALILFRSRRYWYHTLNRMKSILGDIDFDISQMEAWKKTQKLRNARIRMNEFVLYTEKFLLKCTANILHPFMNKQIWLITERKDSASDNSYFLFEYVNKNRRDIKTYYILEKNAEKAKNKVKQVGKVVNFSSIKHKLLMLLADKYITSFTIEETLLPYDTSVYKKIYKKELLKKIIISIQHGMIIHNISPYLSKSQYSIDYITANSQYEKDIIVETLGYNNDDVLITGMSRHDNLLDKSVATQYTKEVLFMPTWQRGLQNLTVSQFLESNFYKKIYSLLNNERLIQFLKREQLHLNVLMHPQFEKYVQYLKSNKEEITFLSMSDVEIPNMIAKSKFLITDFSSVAVDFLFQQKNVVFYQYNKYVSHHVPSKQIKYSDIGQIVTDLVELESALNNLRNNDYNLLPQYKNSYEKLFEVKENVRKNTVNTIMNLK